MNRLSIKPGVAWPAIVALLTLVGVLIPHWITPGYYYDDDVRHYFMVAIHLIGTELQQGNWPLLTLRSAYSGDLIGEGQFGLFNPLTLLLYVVVSRISDLGSGALFYAGFHLVAMALGVYALARRFAIQAPWAALGGIAYATGGMNSYWYAPSWWNALTANSWLIWALVGWLSVFQQRRAFLLAALGTAALLMSGWAHGSVALALCVGILALHYSGQSKTSAPILDALAVGFGALLVSLLAIVPLAFHVLETDRAHSSVFHNGILSATLENLISIGWPSHEMAWPHFFGSRAAQPHYYAAWFILPVLLLNARHVGTAWRERSSGFKVLVLLSGVFAVLSLGPEQIGPLRWPFRFVPYFQLFALLATLKLASMHPPRLGSPIPLALLGLFGFFICWQQAPGDLVYHLSFSLLGFVAAWTAFVQKDGRVGSAILLGTTLLIAAAIHLEWPRNDNVGHWPAPSAGKIDATVPLEAGRVLILQPQARDDAQSWKSLPSGNVALWENRPFINGYSPVRHSVLARTFCFNTWSWSCDQAVDRLLALDSTTGVDRASLLRIEEVRTAAGTLGRTMEKLAPDRGFVRVGATSDHTIWRRPIVSLPGTLSWHSPKLQIRTAGPASAAEERYHVKNTDGQSARMIWARIDYPGYRATLDGTPLPLDAYDGMLVAVTIPPHAEGELVLTHRLPGWPWTPIAALAGVLMVMARAHWRRPSTQIGAAQKV